MRNAKRSPGLAPSLAALGMAALLAGCGGTSGSDSSPIPSTGVPLAARDARGVRVADHATAPSTAGDGDPYIDPLYDDAPPQQVTPVPPPTPQDPFSPPPVDAPPEPPTPPAPKPPPTGVPL